MSLFSPFHTVYCRFFENVTEYFIMLKGLDHKMDWAIAAYMDTSKPK
jgi:hypothetical protein